MRHWIDILREFVEPNRARIAEIAFQNFDWSGGDGDDAISQYCYDHDLDLEEHEDQIDTKSPEFLKWFGHYINDRYADAEIAIEQAFEGGLIKLYRAITAPRGWQPDPNRHPGVYWSWDFKAAEAHWGDFRTGNKVWILETSVPMDAIDWEVTLAANAQHPEEREVHLRQGYPVVIEDYYEDFKRRRA